MCLLFSKELRVQIRKLQTYQFPVLLVSYPIFGRIFCKQINNFDITISIFSLRFQEGPQFPIANIYKQIYCMLCTSIQIYKLYKMNKRETASQELSSNLLSFPTMQQKTKRFRYVSFTVTAAFFTQFNTANSNQTFFIVKFCVIDNMGELSELLTHGHWGVQIS